MQSYYGQSRAERSELIARTTLAMSREHIGRTIFLPPSGNVATRMGVRQANMYRDKPFAEHAGDLLGLQHVHYGHVLGIEERVTDYAPPRMPAASVREVIDAITSSLSPEQVGQVIIALASRQAMIPEVPS